MIRIITQKVRHILGKVRYLRYVRIAHKSWLPKRHISYMPNSVHIYSNSPTSQFIYLSQLLLNPIPNPLINLSSSSRFFLPSFVSPPPLPSPSNLICTSTSTNRKYTTQLCISIQACRLQISPASSTDVLVLFLFWFPVLISFCFRFCVFFSASAFGSCLFFFFFILNCVYVSGFGFWSCWFFFFFYFRVSRCGRYQVSNRHHTSVCDALNRIETNCVRRQTCMIVRALLRGVSFGSKMKRKEKQSKLMLRCIALNIYMRFISVKPINSDVHTQRCRACRKREEKCTTDFASTHPGSK